MCPAEQGAAVDAYNICNIQARIIRNLRWRINGLQVDLESATREADMLRVTLEDARRRALNLGRELAAERGVTLIAG